MQSVWDDLALDICVQEGCLLACLLLYSSSRRSPLCCPAAGALQLHIYRTKISSPLAHLAHVIPVPHLSRYSSMVSGPFSASGQAAVLSALGSTPTVADCGSPTVDGGARP
jgi:hypothetical protein